MLFYQNAGGGFKAGWDCGGWLEMEENTSQLLAAWWAYNGFLTLGQSFEEHAASHLWGHLWTHGNLDPASEWIPKAIWKREIWPQNRIIFHVGWVLSVCFPWSAPGDSSRRIIKPQISKAESERKPSFLQGLYFSGCFGPVLIQFSWMAIHLGGSWVLSAAPTWPWLSVL